jgi:hypothetical protein
VVDTEDVADQSAVIAPPGMVAAAVQFEAAVVDQRFKVTSPARVAAAAGPKVRLTAPDWVLVVTVEFFTVTLVVVVRASLPKVYAAFEKLLASKARVAAPSVLLTDAVDDHAAKLAVVPVRSRKVVTNAPIASFPRVVRGLGSTRRRRPITRSPDSRSR